MQNKNKGGQVLLQTIANAKTDERIVIVTDDTSREIALRLWEAAAQYTNKMLICMNDRSMHGEEPPDSVAKVMFNSDLIYGVTKFSLFHTDARRNAVSNGSRFVNMVDYKMRMMEEGGLFIDFDLQKKVLDVMADQMQGNNIRVMTAKGTDVTASIKGRKPVPQSGRSVNSGDTSSPPDIECAIGPWENTATGTVIIDGSIPHPLLGLLREDIVLTLLDGTITEISGGEEANTLKKILMDFNDPNALRLGEIGIGLNPACTLSGSMLEDEGALGTVHFGFGDSTSFHGMNQSKYHLDMVFYHPTVNIDGRIILDNGVPII